MQVQETKRMTVYGLSDCETISYRNCIRHTPCAAVFRRHTECAGYIGIRHFIAAQRLTKRRGPKAQPFAQPRAMPWGPSGQK